jgi:triacylglycerol lipase
MVIQGFSAAARRAFSRDGLARTPALWREVRALGELHALLRDRVAWTASLPPGRGRPVLLIPGYLAGDSSLRTLAVWLGRAGYRPIRAGMRLNADCPGAAVDELAARIDTQAHRWPRPALIIGQSRGGLLGRVLSGQRPERFAGLITLGSPLLDPFAVHPLLLLNIGVVGVLGMLGVPGVFSARCWRGGACCRAAIELVEKPLPPGFRFVSIYSRTDGIVDWRACLDPAAAHVEVDSSHLGMGSHRAVYRAIATELARLE